MSKRVLTGQGETLLFPVNTVINPRSDHFFYQELRAKRHIVGMKPAPSVQTISRTAIASVTYLGVSTVNGERAFERRVGHIPGLCCFTRCPCLRSRERPDWDDETVRLGVCVLRYKVKCYYYCLPSTSSRFKSREEY
jgi:hypothetical protein